MRFALRDLFWLVLLAGFALGWFVDHRSQAKALQVEHRWQEKAEDLAEYCRRFERWTVTWQDHANGWHVKIKTPKGWHETKSDETGVEMTTKMPDEDEQIVPELP